MFNQPGTGSGDKLDLQANYGALILVYPKEIKIGVQTQALGLKDPLVADVVILDGPMAGASLSDCFIFPGGLIGQLKQYIGAPNPALGRIGKGEAKAGMNAPWKLIDFTDADAAIATAWIHANPRGFSQPAPAAAPPVAAAPAVDPAAAWALEQQRQAAQAQAAYAPPAAAAPPAPANVNPSTGEVGFNLETVRTLIGLNVADHDIAANTGATLEQIAAIRSLPAS
jgi:hypothetical protein